MGPTNKKKGGKERVEGKPRRFDAGDKEIVFKGKPELKKEFSKSKCPFGTGGWHLQELPMASLTPEDVLCTKKKGRKPYKKPEAKSWDDELRRSRSVLLEKIARMRPTETLSLLEAAETFRKHGPKSNKASKDSS